MFRKKFQFSICCTFKLFNFMPDNQITVGEATQKINKIDKIMTIIIQFHITYRVAYITLISLLCTFI